MKDHILRNIRAGFGIAFIILIISSIASFFSIRKLQESNDLVSHTDSVIANAKDIMSILKDAETGQRGYLLTKKEDFLQPYENAYTSAMSSLAELRSLTMDNPKQQERLNRLKILIDQRFVILISNIDRVKKNMPVDPDILSEGKKIMDQCRTEVRSIMEEENLLLQTRTKEHEMYTRYTPFVIVIAALVALFITLLSFFSVRKELNKRLELQTKLEESNEKTAQRIAIIQRMAHQVAQGDFSGRLNATEGDVLGSLATSLDKMTASLDKSFKDLANKEWQLKASFEDLETKVKFRNLELERTIVQLREENEKLKQAKP